MKKKLSKSNLLKNLIEYVFNTYCDDEQVALFAQDYYKLEKRAEERKARKNDIKISKSCEINYKISEDVRNFLEPLVDAEYFKDINYNTMDDSSALFFAMEQLNTKQHLKLLEEIEADK